MSNRVTVRERVTPNRIGVIAAALAVVAALLLVRGCSSSTGGRPATGAARLVPEAALAYLHVSTDGARRATSRTATLASSFQAYRDLRDRFLNRLSPSGAPVDYARDVKPWLGREAALALIDTGRPTAGSLVIAEVADVGRARAFLTHGVAAGATTRYRDVPITPVGRVEVAFAGHYALIGPDATVRTAIDLHNGDGRSLAAAPSFSATDGSLPDDRAADAYVSAAGVRRLLAPQGGLLGVAGTLIDRPGLSASALALGATSGGARVTVSTLVQGAQAAATPFGSFRPALPSSVPANALLYVGLAGFDRALSRLLGGQAQAAAGPAGAALGRLLGRARGALGSGERLGLLSALQSLFGAEVALWVTPGDPAPALALMAASSSSDESLRRTLASLERPLTQLFTTKASGAARAPTVSQVNAGPVVVSTLHLAPGLELDWGAHNHTVVIATAAAPVIAALTPGGRLAGRGAYEATLTGRPARVGSLLFIDFRALLALGEQTGLAGSAAYARVRDDLHRIAALGESSTGSGARSTAQIFLSIP